MDSSKRERQGGREAGRVRFTRGLRRGGFGEFSFGGGRVYDFEDEALAEGVGGAGDGGEGDGGIFGIEQAVELGSDFGGKTGSSWFRLMASRVGMTRVSGWGGVWGSSSVLFCILVRTPLWAAGAF
jgi:hypothetical protein